jgi:hypothetical protein
MTAVVPSQPGVDRLPALGCGAVLGVPGQVQAAQVLHRRAFLVVAKVRGGQGAQWCFRGGDAEDARDPRQRVAGGEQLAVGAVAAGPLLAARPDLPDQVQRVPVEQRLGLVGRALPHKGWLAVVESDLHDADPLDVRVPAG